MLEIWKATDYPGYSVSSLGRLRSEERFVKRKGGGVLHYKQRILKPHVSKKGYLIANFSTPKGGGKYKDTVPMHRLVAKAFIPNPDNLPQVNHKNGDKKDNRVDNLEWVSNWSNHLHKLENGLVPDSHIPKRVGQFDKEGNQIAVYDSIYAAGKAVNSNQYGVSRAVNGKRHTHKGYVWKYVE